MALPRADPVLDFPLATFVLGVWRLGPAAWTVRIRGEEEADSTRVSVGGGRARIERDGDALLETAVGEGSPVLLAEDGEAVKVTRQLGMRWDCGRAPRELPPLPSGYALRHFKPSDLPDLGELYQATFGPGHDAAWYERSFLASGFFSPDRVAVVAHGGRAVSTALAWEFGGVPDPKRGQLHFVATHPSHHDRGLGKVVSAAVQRWFQGDGRREVGLTTDDHRLRAIRAYRTLGFEPVEDGEDVRRRWANVQAALAAGAQR